MDEPSYEFRELLLPVTIDEFVRAYWERKPLYIPGDAQKFRSLFNIDAFFRLVGEGRLGPEGRRPSLKAGYKNAHGEHRELPVQPHQLPSLLDAGMTIQADALESIDPLLRELCTSVRQALGLAASVDAQCVISPDGGGFGLHFDMNAIWVLQIEGEKIWRYSPLPAVDFPQTPCVPERNEREAGIHGFDEAALIEQVLKPGDVLYLPAGTWHRPTAIGRSIHLSIGVYRTNVLELVTELLSKRLFDHADWRHLPSSPATGNQVDLDSYFSNRLEELRSEIAGLTAADLAAAWHARFSDVIAPKLAERAGARLIEGDRFVLARPLRFAQGLGQDEDTVLLLNGSALVGTLPKEAMGLVHAIASAAQFSAGELTRSAPDYTWDDVSELLADLLELGVIRRQ